MPNSQQFYKKYHAEDCNDFNDLQQTHSSDNNISKLLQKKQVRKMDKKQPSRSYAIKKHMPTLSKAIEFVLTNQYIRDSKEIFDLNIKNTYFIIQKNAYYQGEWLNGLPSGRGVAVYQNGSYYQGFFLNGNPHDSHGFLILPNGAFYRGNIQESIINGNGTLRHSNSMIEYEYTGEWKNGKPHGYGQERYHDGSFYKGNFLEGIKNGKGTYFSKIQNQTYKGEFLDGLMHGKGEYTTASGLQFYGNFVRGKREGQGKLKGDEGELNGYFQDGFINGKGLFKWNDGRIYEGMFKKNKFDGEGRILYPMGQVVEGIWENGHNKFLKTVRQQ